jgi:hypothetical protein
VIDSGAWTRTVRGRVLIKRMTDAGIEFRVDGKTLHVRWADWCSEFQEVLVSAPGIRWGGIFTCSLLPMGRGADFYPDVWFSDYIPGPNEPKMVTFGG